MLLKNKKNDPQEFAIPPGYEPKISGELQEGDLLWLRYKEQWATITANHLLKGKPAWNFEAVLKKSTSS